MKGCGNNNLRPRSMLLGASPLFLVVLLAVTGDGMRGNCARRNEETECAGKDKSVGYSESEYDWVG